MDRKSWKICLAVAFLITASLTVFCLNVNAAGTSVSGTTSITEQRLLEKQTYEGERMRQMREKAEAQKRKSAELERLLEADKKKAKQESIIEQLALPEDKTAKVGVKEIQISGNTLVSTTDLIASMPLIYNASQQPLLKAPSQDLYDLRPINQILNLPGEKRDVTMRQIQGFTQYIVSAYQARHYGGIYVYVPRQALMQSGGLVGDVLQVQVIEASVSNVKVNAFDVNSAKRPEPILRRNLIEEWSPAKAGTHLNSKKLDDFVELLNLDPDRYISATVSRGTEANSLAVGYDIYETNPWHYYIQIDNSGTHDRQYKPRLGLVNTDLTGHDDRLILFAQIKPEHGFENNYAIYGSYEVPLWTPRLRWGLFGGRSEFDTFSPSTISFLGHGSFYGTNLRYTVLQEKAWILDAVGSLSDERSQITPSFFPSLFKSNLRWLLWMAGAELHRRNDMSQTNVAYNQYWSSNESDEDEFSKARTGSSPDFIIYNLSGLHSQFLDTYKVNRVSGSIKWIDSNHRLAPAKLTTFGGMYTVRGYKEDRIVADGGLLFSVQYEYDLVKASEKEQREVNRTDANQPPPELQQKQWLKKLAPLCFIDGGRAINKDHVTGEKGTEDLVSIGIGLLGEVKENYTGAIYLGWPLKDADDTEKGHPRLNFSLMARW